jgi:hypothetical protein
MFSVSYDFYTVCCSVGTLPDMYESYRSHAELASEYDLMEPKEAQDSGSPCFVGVSRSGQNDGWPFLTIAQTYSPASAGFSPGVIVIAETNLLMIGAGTRLLAYILDPPRLFWEDDASFGFWGWERHGDIIVMAAELEMAAWDTTGQKLWFRDVEPPWTYSVTDNIVTLDIMGNLSKFPLTTGPSG